ncbi:MAG: Uma2 family endonuclease [Minicystis sp.]
MAVMPAPPPLPARPLPIGPSVEAWRAMSAAEREAFLVGVNEALSDPRAAMSEDRAHYKTKVRSLDMLGLHFNAMGRVVYLAEEMAVVYPSEEVFTPDLLAVVGVEEPEDDQRMAWVVADEKRGLDLVLEVLHRGDRKKDLVDNVERYAHLGIPEYFIYDRAQQRIRGYRLPAPEPPGTTKPAAPRRYLPIVPQGGRYSSMVLGLDLVVQEGSLRFFQGMAELFGSSDLIHRLNTTVRDQEARLEEAETRAAQAASRTGLALALAGLRTGIFAALGTPGLATTEEQRARVASCEDPEALQRWLLRALTAASAGEVFAG